VNVDHLFPSRFLKPADLGEAAPIVTIARLVVEAVGARRERKPVLYFEHKRKGLIVNKTIATQVAAALGKSETDDWPGGRIRLFVTTTMFGRETVPCFRVQATGGAAK
jgi:hypothetical protein